MNIFYDLSIEPTEPANGPGHEDPPDPDPGSGSGSGSGSGTGG